MPKAHRGINPRGSSGVHPGALERGGWELVVEGAALAGRRVCVSERGGKREE